MPERRKPPGPGGTEGFQDEVHPGPREPARILPRRLAIDNAYEATRRARWQDARAELRHARIPVPKTCSVAHGPGLGYQQSEQPIRLDGRGRHFGDNLRASITRRGQGHMGRSWRSDGGPQRGDIVGDVGGGYGRNKTR